MLCLLEVEQSIMTAQIRPTFLYEELIFFRINQKTGEGISCFLFLFYLAVKFCMKKFIPS